MLAFQKCGFSIPSLICSRISKMLYFRDRNEIKRYGSVKVYFKELLFFYIFSLRQFIEQNLQWITTKVLHKKSACPMALSSLEKSSIMEYLLRKINRDVSSDPVLQDFLTAWGKDDSVNKDLMTRISIWYEKENTALGSITDNIVKLKADGRFQNLTGLLLEEVALLFMGFVIGSREQAFSSVWNELLICYLEDPEGASRAFLGYLKFFRFDFSHPDSQLNKCAFLMKKILPSLLSALDTTLPEDALAKSITSLLEALSFPCSDRILEVLGNKAPHAFLHFIWPFLCTRIDLKVNSENTAKHVMMSWWNYLLRSDITIDNFHSSFRDGHPFIYLANHYKVVLPNEQQHDLEGALSELESGLGIPKLFEAGELNNLVDKRSPIVFLYAAECIVAIWEREKAKYCPLCGYRFSLELALLQDKERHHLTSQSKSSKDRFDDFMLATYRPGIRECPECKQSFSSQSMLNGHLVANHYYRKCNIGVCTHAYQTDQELQEHLANHPEKIPCTVHGCEKACYGKDALDKHMKEHARRQRIRRFRHTI